MPGFVSNPFAYMRRSSVFVLSSRFEGLPGVLIMVEEIFEGFDGTMYHLRRGVD